MAFNLGTIGAAVTLDDSDYVNTLGGIEQKTSAVLKKIGGIAASFFGLNALRQFAQDSVKAFIVQENAVNGLERALDRIGKAGYSKKLQDVASSLQNLTTYGDEATLQAMTMGVNMGLAAEQMEEATKAAMGLAAGYSLDLTSAMQLVAKAANGNTSRLAMYGIQVDQTKSKQEQFNEVLKLGNEKFDLAKAETYGQRLTQLGNAWGDLKEEVGEFLLALSGFDDWSEELLNTISYITDVIKENCEQWAFEIKYVWTFFEAGLKNIWAPIEPAATFIVQVFSAAFQNIISIGQWSFDNLDKIWENLPEIFIGICKDIWQTLKDFAIMVYDLFANLGTAIWQAIKGGGLSGFRDLWNELSDDWNNLAQNLGSNTAQALADAGVSAFPDLQSANYGELVDKYAHLSDRFAEIDRERQQKEADLEYNLIERLEKKRTQKQNRDLSKETDPAAAVKNNVAGSFSAAALASMIGAGPEKETAKNTKKMVELQEETNRKLAKKQKYT
jgi:hypothetical protein